MGMAFSLEMADRFRGSMYERNLRFILIFVQKKMGCGAQWAG
jgi:hypothetical protein